MHNTKKIVLVILLKFSFITWYNILNKFDGSYKRVKLYPKLSLKIPSKNMNPSVINIIVIIYKISFINKFKLLTIVFFSFFKFIYI